MQHMCPQCHSHALPKHYFAHPSHSLLQQCLGRAWEWPVGIHVVHVVAYEGSLIYTVFTKKWSKNGQKGGTTFLKGFTLPGTPLG